jgi:hypothetical protein
MVPLPAFASGTGILQMMEKICIFRLLTPNFSRITEFMAELDFDFKSFPTTRYQGSKRKMLPWIYKNVCYHHRDGFRQLGINTVEDCFRSEWSKNMYTPDIDFNWDPEKLEYIKLHGSLDWTYDSNGACVKSGAANLPANLEQMPIIYPGHKNITDKEPFKSTHDRLFSRLNVADYVIVIGFAFRDQLINSHFESALRINKALKIYCYNPCPLNEYPEDSQLSYFANTFKNRFIHVQSKVEIKEKPLSFSGHFNKLTPINSNDII